MRDSVALHHAMLVRHFRLASLVFWETMDSPFVHPQLGGHPVRRVGPRMRALGDPSLQNRGIGAGQRRAPQQETLFVSEADVYAITIGVAASEDPRAGNGYGKRGDGGHGCVSGKMN